jgi:hypothetical protein
MWANEVDKVNALDGLLGKVKVSMHKEARLGIVERTVVLQHPNLQFHDMAKNQLMSLLAEACDGLYRDVMCGCAQASTANPELHAQHNLTLHVARLHAHINPTFRTLELIAVLMSTWV